ncbi:VOC family protein [Sphingobacterium yanglingense]|uniref:PhnB protein n=1 Tax=Sphingobacterium yanglingense TaxID=1437280 RepID=A0A4R6WHN5_9SPHI|nr:VOC family protein [Sphingobacterium yanglingense]TDQ77036.1 PhnB protein [Sphingobacterium yanglingense]
MAKIHAYLNFNGNCEDAFAFYKTVFNTDLIGTYRFGDMPADPNFPLNDEDKRKIMHTALMINADSMLMGSDCIENFGHKATPGTNTYIMLDVASTEEAKKLYDALVVNAQNVEMPLGEQFFAELYASFTDQFGISWMVHYEGKNQMMNQQ